MGLHRLMGLGGLVANHRRRYGRGGHNGRETLVEVVQRDLSDHLGHLRQLGQRPWGLGAPVAAEESQGQREDRGA
jgi:hypothetical protein